MPMNRRRFLTALPASSVASGLLNALQAAQAPRSLVPAQLSIAPNYWCTWAAQNYMYGHNLSALDPRVLEGDSGSNLAHSAMRDQVLFGDAGWAKSFYAQVRGDLFLLLDDGWQVGGTSTFVLDPAKFPRFAGSPLDRLAQLNQAVEAAGWRGAALWCRNTPGGDADRRLEILSQSAGIRYWKVDMGDTQFNLVRLRDQTHAPLTFEHVHGEMPVNGEWSVDGRFEKQRWGSPRIEILKHTDVYRTYDVTSILSLPTTLDRVAQMLMAAQGHSEVHGLLNVEDEVYVAAVLGCTMGIMRHPLTGMRPGKDVDLFFNGPRQAKRRMDEVVRAVRWQRIAPPFSPGYGSIEISGEVLTDSWTFERGQTWQREIIGQTVRQGAPARLARGIALPEVTAQGEKPFLYAARFPNGAVAIGAQERTHDGNAWIMPACDVSLFVSDAPGPFGVFGSFGSLTLIFDRLLRRKQIMAQDLAGDEAIDITNRVSLRGDRLHIPGEVIRSAGLSGRTEGDLSAPGLVIAMI